MLCIAVLCASVAARLLCVTGHPVGAGAALEATGTKVRNDNVSSELTLLLRSVCALIAAALNICHAAQFCATVDLPVNLEFLVQGRLGRCRSLCIGSCRASEYPSANGAELGQHRASPSTSQRTQHMCLALYRLMCRLRAFDLLFAM